MRCGPTRHDPQHVIDGTATLAAVGAAGADFGGGQAGDGSCAYYYCECTQQLNSQYGDLQHKIQDLEVRAGQCIAVHACL
jgi:hypothetical protein